MLKYQRVKMPRNCAHARYARYACSRGRSPNGDFSTAMRRKGVMQTPTIIEKNIEPKNIRKPALLGR